MSAYPPGQLLERSASGGLADVVELVLDKGLVIDASARASVIGIEVFAVEARIVVASIDTYLRYADAMRQLAAAPSQPSVLPDLVEDLAAAKTRGMLDAVTGKIGDIMPGRSAAARRRGRRRGR